MRIRNKFLLAGALALIGGILVWAQQPVAQGPQAGNASEWLFNLTKLASTALGAPTAWGTAPSGNMIGVNANVLSVVPPTPQSTSTYAPSVFDLSATAATNVKGSGGNVYGWFGFNPNTTTCYLQFYNNASATLGTSPLHPFGVVAGGSFNLNSPMPMFNLSTAISTGQTTTASGSTQCSSAMVVSIIYQ